VGCQQALQKRIKPEIENPSIFKFQNSGEEIQAHDIGNWKSFFNNIVGE